MRREMTAIPFAPRRHRRGGRRDFAAAATFALRRLIGDALAAPRRDAITGAEGGGGLCQRCLGPVAGPVSFPS